MNALNYLNTCASEESTPSIRLHGFRVPGSPSKNGAANPASLKFGRSLTPFLESDHQVTKFSSGVSGHGCSLRQALNVVLPEACAFQALKYAQEQLTFSILDSLLYN
jgi:hypothetical protein